MLRGTGMRAIILEFNELTPALMRRFMEMGTLPNFSKLRAESQVFTTDAGEDPPWLEPWIQWVTVHCGSPASEHGIFNLGDSPSLRRPAIWDVVSSAGYPVWVCGSMNAFHSSNVNGAILPDPWSVGIRPSPVTLDPYFDFVRSQVLEYTRPKGSMGLKSALRFAKFMASNGLTLATAGAIASQLLRERVKACHWQRANILDRLQYDLFESMYCKLRPRLATFFLNSTAHYQHVYWRNMEPNLFAEKPSMADQNAYGSAVRFGYERMDAIVGKIMQLVDDQTAIIFITALSQQPCLKYEGIGGKRFYKPVNVNNMLTAVGIDAGDCDIEPVMSEQFHLRFASVGKAQEAYDKLQAVVVEGMPAFASRLNDCSIMTGCGVIRELPPGALLRTGDRAVPFESVFYLVDLKKSGMHHRDGMAWFRIPGLAARDFDPAVSLVDLPPTILRVMGLDAPESMRGRVLPFAAPIVESRPINAAA